MSAIDSAILGIRIFYNPLCLEETDTPDKIYRKPKWQSMRKADLIQKKWNKRFGFAKVPCIFKTADSFIAHPSFKSKLDALIREKIISDYQKPNLSYSGV